VMREEKSAPFERSRRTHFRSSWPAFRLMFFHGMLVAVAIVMSCKSPSTETPGGSNSILGDSSDETGLLAQAKAPGSPECVLISGCNMFYACGSVQPLNDGTFRVLTHDTHPSQVGTVTRVGDVVWYTQDGGTGVTRAASSSLPCTATPSVQGAPGFACEFGQAGVCSQVPRQAPKIARPASARQIVDASVMDAQTCRNGAEGHTAPTEVVLTLKVIQREARRMSRSFALRQVRRRRNVFLLGRDD
jgi:hypothetical protein